MPSVEQLTMDIAEFDRLLSSATRPAVKQAITEAMTKAQRDLQTAKTAQNSSGDKPKTATNVGMSKLSTYAWDQSDKFVKLYVTLKAAQTATDEDVVFVKTRSSIDISVRNVEGKSYQFAIAGLLEEIDADASYFKLKTDTLLLMLKKAEANKKWDNLTLTDKRSKEAKDARMKPTSDKDDPQAGMMSMMKNMYDEGDDEMKRTIKKSWFESQQQKKGGGGGMGGMPDFGGM